MRSFFRDCEKALRTLFKHHNHLHAVKDKQVGDKTQDERAICLIASFKILWDNGYKVMPSGLGHRHIQFLVNFWLERGLACGTIQLRLSYFRVFEKWIGKPGLVRDARDYVKDPSLVQRQCAATKDRSWSAQGVNGDALVAKIFDFDQFVGAQLAMCHAFGLRVKEALCFRPFQDVNNETQEFTLLRGTKGGRPRTNTINSDRKRQAIAIARRVAAVDSGHLGRPDLKLHQNQTRFYTVMRKFGLTRKGRGVTAHGLRHQWANDEYQKLANAPSPVRGGDYFDREADRNVRLQIAKHLGHSRENITTNYCGRILKPATKAKVIEESAASAQHQLQGSTAQPDTWPRRM